jgi:hypothetical protein
MPGVIAQKKGAAVSENAPAKKVDVPKTRAPARNAAGSQTDSPPLILRPPQTPVQTPAETVSQAPTEVTAAGPPAATKIPTKVEDGAASNQDSANATPEKKEDGRAAKVGRFFKRINPFKGKKDKKEGPEKP